MLFIACFLVAMLIAVLMMPALIRMAVPWGLVDKPNARKVHTRNIPRVGGIAIVVGALVPLVLWAEPSRELTAYFLGAVCLLIFGIWDDRRELNYKIKFLGQIIAVSLFIIVGGVSIQWLPFQGLSPIPLWFSILLTFIALLGITNAVNLVDGLDGLAGGTSLLSLGAIALLAYLSGGVMLVMLALAIAGSIFGFLRYNTHPAVIFMGDTGSQFLGYSIGVAAVLLTQQVNTALSPVLPLILMGLPILDTLTVMTRRMMGGRSPFSADKNHFHHRLMKLGLEHYEAVIVIYLVQIALIVLAFVFKYQADWVLLCMFVAFCIGFNGLFYLAETGGWRYQRSWLSTVVQPLFKTQSVVRYKMVARSLIRPFLFLSLPVYLFLCLWQAQAIDGIGLLYVAMFVLSLILVLSPLQQAGWLSRSVWYAACGLGVYCSAQTGLIETVWIKLYIALIAAAVLLSFQLEAADNFRINPLDVIVLVSAGLLFYLSGVNEHFDQFGAQLTQAIIFLYAVELMLDGKPSHRSLARWALSFIFGITSVLALS